MESMLLHGVSFYCLIIVYFKAAMLLRGVTCGYSFLFKSIKGMGCKNFKKESNINFLSRTHVTISYAIRHCGSNFTPFGHEIASLSLKNYLV